MIFNQKFWTGIALGGLGSLYLLNLLKERDREPTKREKLEALADKSQKKGKEMMNDLISRMDLESADMDNVDQSELMRKIMEMENQNNGR